MFAIDDSILSLLNPDVRAQLQEAVAQSTVSTPALVYRPVNHSIPRDASCISGFPCTDTFDWPVDKNKNAMTFWAQLNFEDANSTNQSLSPKAGVLMLFVSVDYRQFRAKDQSWYRLVYAKEPNSTPYKAETIEIAKRLLPKFKLVPELVGHARSNKAELLMEKVPALSLLPVEQRDKVLTWFHDASKRAEERLKDAHQICCTDEQAREACVMAAFYANGISFDQARKADGHYKHLVDYASEWEALWRLGGLERFMPGEARQLVICIHRQNLIEFDFSKSVAVFL